MALLSYRRHRFQPPIIQHAIWLYLRFTLGYRDAGPDDAGNADAGGVQHADDGRYAMVGMMQMMMGQHMAVHVEGRIAFLKAELEITGAQLPLWNAVADAMRANAKSITGMPDQMAMMQSATPLPERLAAHEKMMATHLEGLRKLKAAIDPLYAALDSGQKRQRTN